MVLYKAGDVAGDIPVGFLGRLRLLCPSLGIWLMGLLLAHRSRPIRVSWRDRDVSFEEHRVHGGVTLLARNVEGCELLAARR